MSTPKDIFYENQANSIIKKLELRHMKGFYVSTMEEAEDLVLKLIGDAPKSVGYGGSMTIDNSDLKQRITDSGHQLIVRENYKTPEEQRELKGLLSNCDTFLMSTNAITLDGELINIDGRGNRVSYLIYGPAQVIVIAGMNKVVSNLEEGLERAHNFASAPNCVRLGCDTPCARIGRCGNCLEHTICCQEVITRASQVHDRIKVILVGQTLGY